MINMLKKYKSTIIIGLFILVVYLIFFQLYSIFLPFLLALILTTTVDPLIRKMQKLLKSRALSVSLFLLGTLAVFVAIIFFLGQFVNRDFKRLNRSFTTIAAKNKTQIDQSAQQVKTFIAKLYDVDKLENQLKTKADSIQKTIRKKGFSGLDTESIQESISKMKSLFQSNEQTETQQKSGVSIWYILAFTLLYFVLILYQYDYFISIRKKYLNDAVNTKLNRFYEDFNQSFVLYFRLRSRIILILCLIYGTGFAILDLPGMILITILIGFLSYVPYLQFLALIPLAISCLVVSIEQNQSFLLLFGIVVGIFILVLLIDELILYPRIMERKIGINPVILFLLLCMWANLFGIYGIIFGIPLSSLLIIYLKRYLIPALNAVSD